MRIFDEENNGEPWDFEDKVEAAGSSPVLKSFSFPV
jgi:hypothetical protein